MALTSPGVIKAANELLVAVKPEINIIKQFQYDISDAVADFGAEVRVAIVDGGTAEQYNADTSNYGHATGALSNVFVTLDAQPKSTTPITQTDKLELPNDQFWTRTAEAGARSIAKSISAKIGGLFTAAACTGGKAVLAFDDTKTDAYNRKQLAKLRAACPGRVSEYVLGLDPDNYNTMLSLFADNIYGDKDPVQEGYVPRLFGFKAVVQLNDLPSGVTGALIPASGLAIAIRPVAIPDPAAYPECEVVSDEQGFSITAMRHTDFNTATCWFNTTCLVGATLALPGQTKYIAAS